MIRLPDGRVAVAFQAHNHGHEDYWRLKFERGRGHKETAGWANWEYARIAGIVAEKMGEFATLPLKAIGRPIEVNARTGYSGSLQVDLLEDGRFDTPLLRSRQMTGNLRWQPLQWEQGDPASLNGKTIRLRFHLYDTKVFGVRGDGLEIVSPYGRK